MTEPAAIPAQYVKHGTMADGTVRVVVDVPSEYVVHVAAMLSKPGVPVALARLQNEAMSEAEQGKEAPSVTPFPSPTHAALKASQEAWRLCRSERFQRFLREKMMPDDWMTERSASEEENARAVVLYECGVASRGDIPHNAEAAKRWAALVTEYHSWLKAPAYV